MTSFSIKFINPVLAFFIHGLRPLLGPASCKYRVTCGAFALNQLKKHSTPYALYTIFKRILSCNPFF